MCCTYTHCHSVWLRISSFKCLIVFICLCIYECMMWNFQSKISDFSEVICACCVQTVITFCHSAHLFSHPLQANWESPYSHMQTTTNKGKSYLLKLYSQRIVGYWVKWCLHCYLISVYCQCSIKIHSYTHTSIPFQYIATVQTLITRYFAPYPVSLSQTLQTTMNPG